MSFNTSAMATQTNNLQTRSITMADLQILDLAARGTFGDTTRFDTPVLEDLHAMLFNTS
jgi:hypothetical protein